MIPVIVFTAVCLTAIAALLAMIYWPVPEDEDKP